MTAKMECGQTDKGN